MTHHKEWREGPGKIGEQRFRYNSTTAPTWGRQCGQTEKKIEQGIASGNLEARQWPKRGENGDGDDGDGFGVFHPSVRAHRRFVSKFQYYKGQCAV